VKEVGARDLVMAGLVILGLLTVIAGVLSGRHHKLRSVARRAPLQRLADSVELRDRLVGRGLRLGLGPIGDEDAQIALGNPHVDAVMAGTAPNRTESFMSSGVTFLQRARSSEV
jgi:hypothetical protein